jgi:hypothetical protein
MAVKQRKTKGTSEFMTHQLQSNVTQLGFTESRRSTESRHVKDAVYVTLFALKQKSSGKN